MLIRSLLHPTRKTLTVTLGLSSAILATSNFHASRLQHTSHLLRCDAPRSFSDIGSKTRSAASSSANKSGIDARSVRQVSAGSIIGLVGGLAVSTFSKPLTILIGLLVLGVQALESRGIHLIPYQRLQRMFRDVDVKKLASRNVPFKIAFGSTFALAAFAEL